MKLELKRSVCSGSYNIKNVENNQLILQNTMPFGAESMKIEENFWQHML